MFVCNHRGINSSLTGREETTLSNITFLGKIYISCRNDVLLTIISCFSFQLRLFRLFLCFVVTIGELTLVYYGGKDNSILASFREEDIIQLQV